MTVTKINPKVIDIDHGDSVHDFAAAKSFGIRGVIHKATQGSHFVDGQYELRRKMAADAGLLWGAYHFNDGTDPVVQAKHFCVAADPDDATMVVLDFEDYRSNMTVSGAITFLKELADLVGRRPVLYSGNRIKKYVVGLNTVDLAFLGSIDLWMCEYGAIVRMIDDNHRPLPWSAPFLWQFTGDGIGPMPHQIPGVGSPADVSHFGGTDDQLAARWAA